jgi:hypothetical protein
MANRRLEVAALAAAVALAGCATEKKVKASSEVIYEESSNAGNAQAAAPSDPFEGCEAKQQPPAVVLACGSVVAAYIELPQSLSAAQIEQNFNGFEGSFPQQSTRERFTQNFGALEAVGSRVYENSPVAPFRSDMLIIPLAERGTRVLSCRVTGSVDWNRCGKMTEEMAAGGIPARVAGAGGGAMPGGTLPSTSTSSGGTTPTGPR